MNSNKGHLIEILYAPRGIPTFSNNASSILKEHSASTSTIACEHLLMPNKYLLHYPPIYHTYK